MSVNPANAIAAYSNSARANIPAIEPPAPKGPSFTQLVESAADQAITVQKQAEHQANLAAVGKADLTEVVTAVANAEVTLQTVVSLRDKVVSAYQEIMRLPI